MRESYKSKIIFLIILMLLGLSLGVLSRISRNNAVLKSMESFVSSLTSPIMGFCTATGSSIRESYLNASGAFIKAETLAALRTENIALKTEVQRLKALERENFQLRALTQSKNPVFSKVITAEVIGRDALQWFNYITVNRGSKSGITTDWFAFAPQGLIGRVVKVTSGNSRIRLINDAYSAVPAMVSNGSLGIAYGKGEDRGVLNFIDSASSLKTGDLVLTSGLGKVFPKGMLMGEIYSVQGIPGSLFKEAYFKIKLDLSNLRFVQLGVK